ncbi:MAG TPA: DsbA family protein [Noviherbaspirillum sp.]|uniref:DsbA family protein n=1 Tax=Noviherbaspirillum sp. TaxID=1926288 RepID=UPI002B46DD9D|nr:DsbA family protein [Noviherbaspirillum sp.]HJV86162.1 DsbA family protein [Noviherbaspirillum sp.]
MPSLIYIADPMCSWCYGFGPELAALLEGLPGGMPLEIMVGGLRPYTTKPMDAALKASLLEHWRKVSGQTGLPFDYDALSRDGFVYNTEPACRAVVAARMLAPQLSLFVFHALQRAFYAEGQDVTQGNVLAEIVSAALTEAGHPTDAATFLTVWNSDAAITATRDDFLQAERWGITGFPTLVLEHNGKLDLVTSGFVQMPKLIGLLQEIVDREQATSPS